MDFTSAFCEIEGLAAYSQSKQHDEASLEGEDKAAYDIRTWKSKMTVETIKGQPAVVIPGHGMTQAIQAAAKYTKRKIPNAGNATWTKKFVSGAAILSNIPILADGELVHPDSDKVRCHTISCNADGVRGSGKRVPRRFPVIDAGWTAVFEVQILDPIITYEVFKEMLTIAGMFIGVGRYRPENGGTNGRFAVRNVEWIDKRQLILAA